MATFNKFNNFTKALGDKLHNLGADSFKVQLLNTTLTAVMSVEADLPADLGTANGYTANGVALSGNSWTTSGGVAKLTLTDKVVTATGGAIGPFRYVAIFNDTATSDDLIGWFDYGSALTLNNGETFTIDFDGTNGVLTIT